MVTYWLHNVPPEIGPERQERNRSPPSAEHERTRKSDTLCTFMSKVVASVLDLGQSLDFGLA